MSLCNPYFSKAPLSFAIHTPAAMGPIDEYATVILVCASARVAQAEENATSNAQI